MYGWSGRDIPHKGWSCIDVIDLGEGLEPGENIKYEQCDMCGIEKIRFVHVLKHPDFPNNLHVGCDCASKLTNDYVNPQRRERDLKNKINRRKNFTKQGWPVKPTTGNLVLSYKGDNITIMKSKFSDGFGIAYKGQYIWSYHGQKINDIETAKQIAFELFDKDHTR